MKSQPKNRLLPLDLRKRKSNHFKMSAIAISQLTITSFAELFM